MESLTPAFLAAWRLSTYSVAMTKELESAHYAPEPIVIVLSALAPHPSAQNAVDPYLGGTPIMTQLITLATVAQPISYLEQGQRAAASAFVAAAPFLTALNAIAVDLFAPNVIPITSFMIQITIPSSLNAFSALPPALNTYLALAPMAPVSAETAQCPSPVALNAETIPPNASYAQPTFTSSAQTQITQRMNPV